MIDITTLMALDQPQVMGILNVTPDSFSDGGKHRSLDDAVAHAMSMIEAGASIIDIGGESTRPGAAPVSVEQEIARVVPVIEVLAKSTDVLISIDTSKPEVMEAAVNAGARMINDVRALALEGALDMAAALGVPVCLMHMQGEPATMQRSPRYDNVVDEVMTYLMARVEACVQAGISKQQIVIDPGYGFGKTLDHNYQLVASLPKILSLGFPVLAGASRKSMIGQLLDRDMHERLAGSLALATLFALHGAHIIRVHDVAETADVVKVVKKIKQFQ